MKTHQQKIEDIRKACIKANPEIVELKFGCNVKRYATPEIDTLVRIFTDTKGGFGVWLIRQEPHDYDTTFRFLATREEVESWQIIGRPIRLADVLLAITQSEKNWNNEEYGCVGLEIQEDRNEAELETNEKGWAKWNLLKDNLEDQSEPTIDFLWSLLCKE